jgi:HK97 gp10 family phage protein
MAVVIQAQFPDLSALREQFRQLPLKASADYYEKAIRAALQPAKARLMQLTPVGPTGNLRAAIAIKTKRYSKTGNAVGLVGYRVAGRAPAESAAGGTVLVAKGKSKDRAFHQGFVEFGTRQRRVDTFSNTPYMRREHLRNGRPVRAHMVSGQNAYIASSFRRLGPFAIRRFGNAASGAFRTDPPSPKAFFQKSASPIVIRPMDRQSPIKRAFSETQGQMAEILRERLTVSLEQALATFRTASVPGIDLPMSG